MTGSCPPVRDLQRLVRAQIDDRDAQPLLQHLRQCARCLEIRNTFQADEPPPAAPLSEEQTTDEDEDLAVTWLGGLPPKSGPSTPPADDRSRVRTPIPPAPAKAPSGVLPVSPSRATLPRVSADSTQELVSLLAPPQEPGELGRLASYRVLQVLGSGSTGVVVLAEDVHLRRQVALKVMKPAPEADDLARQRFLREAQATAVLDHDHIVAIYQVGEDRGVPFLAMKLLQGETLDDRLKRDGQLFIHEVLRIGREVAEGLEAAHERGLIHRDIKPANIFLEAGQDRVKIVDFGLARAVSDDVHLTKTGTIVGTPAYMSPEQAHGARVDHRSDLFSLGCVLYRMCTGRTPFKADDTLGMLTAITQDQPLPIKAFNADVPDELAGLVSRLLAKLPEGRPQSARSVADVLGAIAELAAARATGGPPRPPRGRSERRLWVTLLGMMILGGLTWAAVCYGPGVARAVRAQVREWADETSRAGNR
jgi:serine/threonine protein kinase